MPSTASCHRTAKMSMKSRRLIPARPSLKRRDRNGSNWDFGCLRSGSERRSRDAIEVRSGSCLCENSSGRVTRRNISEQLHPRESNHTAHARFDALRENCVFYILRMYEFLHNQGQTRRSKQHHYSISSSARTTRHVEAECLGGFEIDCEGVTARRRVAGQFECAPYENRADARGGSDDENSHCSNGCRDLGKCDIRRANHGGCALRRLRGRRQRTAGRCAPRLCVLSGLWGTPARAQLQLVPHAGL
jgi:hypothetical protein